MEEYYKPQFPHLCSPLQIGRLTLRNRMCSAPMGFPDLTEDGLLTEGAIAFYENRARGGAAVVTVSEACVDYVHGKGHGRLINLQNPGVLAGLTNCARAIQRHGALASIELNHAGMLSSFDTVKAERQADKELHYGPVDTVTEDGTVVRGMDAKLIQETILLFRRGAALVKKAGFDMLMLHAGHGWLLYQFLSPTTNTRRDEYGGSLENRARLTVEILDAIREEVGPDFPIELRMSGMAWADPAWTQEEAAGFAGLIESRVDILHVSVGAEQDFGHTHPTMFEEPGCNVPYAAAIKRRVSIPVAAVGALNEPEQMESVLAEGKADLVCMARALLADPELPQKVEQNRTDEILRCMRCFVCHAERMLTQTRICAVNPQIGREYEAKFDARPTVPKRLLIAGGGPAGMQAAITAAQRGHRVTLCEKSVRLGGQLNCESTVLFKAAFPKYIKTMTRRMEAAGVDIRLNTSVTPEFVRKFRPDALFAAIGAEPLRPPIPGLNLPQVISVTELDRREKEIGRRIAVIGGGLAGCECGLHLALQGHEVTIVEMRSEPAPDGNPRHRPELLKQLHGRVRLLTETEAIRVSTQGLLCRRAGEDLLIEADTVLLAAGLRAKTGEVNALRGTAPVVQVIGDCQKPGMLRQAVFRAYHAALDL